MGAYIGKIAKKNYDSDSAIVYFNALKDGDSLEEAAKKQDFYILKREKEREEFEMIRENLQIRHLSKLERDIEPSFIHKFFHNPMRAILEAVSE